MVDSTGHKQIREKIRGLQMDFKCEQNELILGFSSKSRKKRSTKNQNSIFKYLCISGR